MKNIKPSFNEIDHLINEKLKTRILLNNFFIQKYLK